MKFGVCTGLENAATLAAAGYDFIELNVQSALIPERPEAEFLPLLESIKRMKVPAFSANVMLPGHLKVTGPEYDERKLARYMETLCGRAMRAGITRVVFGSGGAKRVPDGFSHEKAYEQLVEFGRLAGHIAEACGVMIVVEPLNKDECNIITSVGEAARYVKDVGKPAVKLLVDSFHFMKDDNDLDALLAASPLLVHSHIATRQSRKAPGVEPCDFSVFFKTLKKGGYNGSISVEGGWNDLPKEAVKALEVMRSGAAA